MRLGLRLTPTPKLLNPQLCSGLPEQWITLWLQLPTSPVPDPHTDITDAVLVVVVGVLDIIVVDVVLGFVRAASW